MVKTEGVNRKRVRTALQRMARDIHSLRLQPENEPMYASAEAIAKLITHPRSPSHTEVQRAHKGLEHFVRIGYAECVFVAEGESIGIVDYGSGYKKVDPRPDALRKVYRVSEKNRHYPTG